MTENSTLSFGLVNGRPVFMDPAHDCYFALSQKEEAEFLDKRRSRCCSPASGRAAHDPIEIIEANPPRPASSLLDLHAPQSARFLQDLVRIACLQRRVRTELARKPIAELLCPLSLKESSDPQFRTNREIVDLSLRYFHARKLLPFKPNCLVDTLTLGRWLGAAPRLLMIFGVKLDPFAAHCWAQLDDMVLNDRCDHVAPFQPVRVIECTRASR